MDKKPTLIERAAAIEAWVEPQRQASYNQHVNDRDVNVHVGFALAAMLDNAMYSLKHYLAAVQFDPKRALDESNLERMSLVDLLLPRLENWMEGKWSAYQLVNMTFEYSKNRVMSGDVAQINCTSMLVNIFSIYEYRNYCELMKTINGSIVGFEQHKEDTIKREVDEAEKKGKRKGKQTA